MESKQPRAKYRCGVDDVEGGIRERGIFMTLYDFLDKHASQIGALMFVISAAWVLGALVGR